jgi:hypothetical protein
MRPETKFIYGFGREVGERNIRDVCEEALINQAVNYPDGVTMKQIEDGIFEGIDFIAGGGFNCSHEFKPVTKETKKQIDITKKIYNKKTEPEEKAKSIIEGQENDIVFEEIINED